MIKYNGIYCCIYKDDKMPVFHNEMLRFYDDGTVISSHIQQRLYNDNMEYAPTGYFPEGNWFCKEFIKEKNLPNGIYQINDNKIEFKTKWSTIDIKYDGIIEENSLILNTWSSNANKQFDKKYVFYADDEI